MSATKKGIKPGYELMDTAYVSAGAPKKYQPMKSTTQTVSFSAGDIGMLKKITISGGSPLALRVVGTAAHMCGKRTGLMRPHPAAATACQARD